MVLFLKFSAVLWKNTALRTTGKTAIFWDRLLFSTAGRKRKS
jgi:hypothetical protein